MWLVNAETLRLEQHTSPLRDAEDLVEILGDAFPETAKPVEYSVLSHRWLGEEVTFKEMTTLDVSTYRSKQGFHKIQKCCQQSLKDGIKHVWIDTCCINKDSDAELSESINSMYTWYQQATVCYTLIHDHDQQTEEMHTFVTSEWFARGWTLQELLASSKIDFFDRNWLLIGDRRSLSTHISAATRIEENVIRDSSHLASCSVAQRMSWAATRTTTRPEDRAYSLLGIFGVNMPLLYGEGGLRAFQRLQEEIIRATADHTIFAWERTHEPANHGLLALTPNAFRSSRTLQRSLNRKGRAPPVMTSRGVSMTLSLTPWCMNTYMALLDCWDYGKCRINPHANPDIAKLGIFLHRWDEDDCYVRVSVRGESILYDVSALIRGSSGEYGTLGQPPLVSKDVQLYIRQKKIDPMFKSALLRSPGYGFALSSDLLGMHLKPKDLAILISGSETYLEEVNSGYTLVKKNGVHNYSFFGTLDLTAQNKKIEYIRLYLDFDFNPIIFMVERSALDEKVRIVAKSNELDFTRSYEWQLTDKGKEEAKPFSERDIGDQCGWNTIYRINGHDVARSNTFRAGLWMLKGDRLDGLDVILSGLGTDAVHPARLRIEREPVPFSVPEAASSLWGVHLQNVPSTTFSLDCVPSIAPGSMEDMLMAE